MDTDRMVPYDVLIVLVQYLGAAVAGHSIAEVVQEEFKGPAGVNPILAKVLLLCGPLGTAHAVVVSRLTCHLLGLLAMFLIEGRNGGRLTCLHVVYKPLYPGMDGLILQEFLQRLNIRLCGGILLVDPL